MEQVARKYWTEETGNTTVDRVILGTGVLSLTLALAAALATPGEQLADATPPTPLSQDV